MSFLESYKRLDNLCKDMFGSDKGVTSYIEAMERISNGSYRVHSWDSDYKNLKHYRYIRNQIVHENYANEDSMCSETDTEWLEEFYSRILGRIDPLALYRKFVTPQKVVNPSVIQASDNYRITLSRPAVSRSHSWIAALVICILSLIIGASFHGLRMHPENAEVYLLGCTVGMAAAVIAAISFLIFIILLVRSKHHKR